MMVLQGHGWSHLVVRLGQGRQQRRQPVDGALALADVGAGGVVGSIQDPVRRHLPRQEQFCSELHCWHKEDN